MLFSEKYKGMRPLKDEIGGICRGRKQGRCWMCGTRTQYFEINYEAYVCSEECLAEMDRDYFSKFSDVIGREGKVSDEN